MVRLCGDVLGLESGEDGTARNHYRAPDGNVYELMGRAPASAEASTHG